LKYPKQCPGRLDHVSALSDEPHETFQEAARCISIIFVCLGQTSLREYLDSPSQAIRPDLHTAMQHMTKMQDSVLRSVE
jgi:hypothetical protein